MSKEAAVAYFRCQRDYYSEMKPVTQSDCSSSVGIQTGYILNTKQPRYKREAHNKLRNWHSHFFKNGIGRPAVL